MSKLLEIEFLVLRETPKAYLVKKIDLKGDVETFIPKSQITLIFKKPKDPKNVILGIPEWLAIKRGWVETKTGWTEPKYKKSFKRPKEPTYDGYVATRPFKIDFWTY